MSPSHSKAQHRLMGAALAMKRGKTKSTGRAGKIAKTMSEKDLEEMAMMPEGKELKEYAGTKHAKNTHRKKRKIWRQ